MVLNHTAVDFILVCEHYELATIMRDLKDYLSLVRGETGPVLAPVHTHFKHSVIIIIGRTV